MKISEYLNEKKYLILVFIICTVFTGAVIYVNGDKSLFESNGFYAVEVSLSVFTVYLIVDYIRMNCHYKAVKALYEKDGMDWIVSLPSPSNFEQKVYTELLYKLKKDADSIVQNYHNKTAENLEFLETWVHEIKTPIAASKLIIENNLNHPTEKALYALSDEVDKIEDMVQTTLYYSHLDNFSKDYQIDRVDLQKVINGCIEREYSNITNKKIHLIIQNVNMQVDTDGKWLSFIVKQIIDNAIKYSLRNGTVQLYVQSEEKEDVLYIEDFGIGIKEGDLRRVFDKNFTGSNGRKVCNSTGIGLYLSQKLARKLGHFITISSTLGKGTKVSIHFPKCPDIYDL